MSNLCVRKKLWRKKCWFISIEKECKKQYVLIKEKKAFSTAEILKCHINDCFKINGEKMISMSNKGEYVRFKNYERKIKWQFITYVFWTCFSNRR